MGKQPACPSHSALHFIVDQQGIVLVTERPKVREKTGGSRSYPTFSLNRFDQDGADIVIE
jgi:hypothetical protein